MQLRRIITISAVVYLVVFFIDAIASSFLGIENVSGDTVVPPLLWFISVASIIFFAWIGTDWYFRKPLVKKGFIQGFLLGLIMVCTWVVLDIVTIFPSVVSIGATFDILKGYYSETIHWLTIVLVFVIALLQGNWAIDQ